MVGADRLAAASEALAASLGAGDASRQALAASLAALDETLPRLEAWVTSRETSTREAAE